MEKIKDILETYLFHHQLLKLDLFKTTQLRLTLNYMLAICFLALSFALAFYIVTYFNLEADLNKNNPQALVLVTHLLTSFDHVPKFLLIIYLGVIVLAGLWGHYLGGKALAPIQQNMEAQKKFFADASHQLRTPLTVMKADLEITLRHAPALDDRSMESLNTTLHQVNKMSQMIDDFLLLSRLENKQDPLHLAVVDLNNIITHILKTLEFQASKKNVLFNFNCLSPVTVMADREKIYHALLHLLTRVLYDSSSGQTIEVEINIDQRSAVIKISDYQANLSPQNNSLDLVLAQSIIDKHHGTLSVDNFAEKGTVITTHLPLAN